MNDHSWWRKVKGTCIKKFENFGRIYFHSLPLPSITRVISGFPSASIFSDSVVIHKRVIGGITVCPLRGGVKCCDIKYIRLFVICLFVSGCQSVWKTTRPNFTKFSICCLARSSCGGVMIGHVLPVLRMTSCLRTLGRTVRHVCS